MTTRHRALNHLSFLQRPQHVETDDMVVAVLSEDSEALESDSEEPIATTEFLVRPRGLI